MITPRYGVYVLDLRTGEIAGPALYRYAQRSHAVQQMRRMAARDIVSYGLHPQMTVAALDSTRDERIRRGEIRPTPERR